MVKVNHKSTDSTRKNSNRANASQGLSTGTRGAESVLRVTPVNPLEQVAELSRRDHQGGIGGRWPNKFAVLKTFGIKRHAEAVMPKDFYKFAASAAKDVEISAVRISLKGFLNQQCERVHAAAHIGMARRNPNAYPRRNGDHCPNKAFAIADANRGSTTPLTVIRAPLPNSIAIRPSWQSDEGAVDATEVGAATVTSAKLTRAGAAETAISSRKRLRQ